METWNLQIGVSEINSEYPGWKKKSLEDNDGLSEKRKGGHWKLKSQSMCKKNESGRTQK